jgi:hypothetical protein
MRAPEPSINPAFTLFSDDALGFAIGAARSDKLPTRPAAHVPPPIKERK